MGPEASVPIQGPLPELLGFLSGKMVAFPESVPKEPGRSRITFHDPALGVTKCHVHHSMQPIPIQGHRTWSPEFNRRSTILTL